MEMKKLLRAYGIRDTNLLKDKQMIMVRDQHYSYFYYTKIPTLTCMYFHGVLEAKLFKS